VSDTGKRSSKCVKLRVSDDPCSPPEKCGVIAEHELRSPLPQNFGCHHTYTTDTGDTLANIDSNSAADIMAVNPQLKNVSPDSLIDPGTVINIPPCPSLWLMGLQLIPTPVNTDICPVTRRYLPGVFFLQPYLRRYTRTDVLRESECEEKCNQLVDCWKWTYNPEPNSTFICLLKPILSADNAVASSADAVSGCIRSRLVATPAPEAEKEKVLQGGFCNAYDQLLCAPPFRCIDDQGQGGYVGICGTIQLPSPEGDSTIKIPNLPDLTMRNVYIVIASVFVYLLCIACCACRMYRTEKSYLNEVLESLPDGTLLPRGR